MGGLWSAGPDLTGLRRGEMASLTPGELRPRRRPADRHRPGRVQQAPPRGQAAALAALPAPRPPAKDNAGAAAMAATGTHGQGPEGGWQRPGSAPGVPPRPSPAVAGEVGEWGEGDVETPNPRRGRGFGAVCR